MTFEEILKVNKMMQLTEIKGKEYASVNQRVKAFRMLYPEGRLTTEWLVLDLENGMCCCKVTAYTADGTILAQGTAEETRNSTYINKTSFVENCETSATGRCLGFCGLGIDSSICSKEELEIAEKKQEELKKKSAEKRYPPSDYPQEYIPRSSNDV